MRSEREDTGPRSREEAVKLAFDYAERERLGDELWVHEVYYSKFMDEAEVKRMEESIGRQFDEEELVLLHRNDKSRWIVQLVFESCEAGNTPQGPRILVDDDGEISHYRPM